MLPGGLGITVTPLSHALNKLGGFLSLPLPAGFTLQAAAAEDGKAAGAASLQLCNWAQISTGTLQQELREGDKHTGLPQHHLMEFLFHW